MSKDNERGTPAQGKEEIIRSAISNEVVAQYFTATWGEYIGVYQDGSTGIGQSIGMEIVKDERPIAILKCPGIANMDSHFWTEGWTKYNSNTGMYITEDDHVLPFETCIRECCMEDDEIKESLIQEFIKAI